MKLRGEKAELEAEGDSIIEQTQYTDIGASDNYLQLQMAAGAAIAGRFVDIREWEDVGFKRRGITALAK